MTTTENAQPPPAADQPQEEGGQGILAELADTALETGREVLREQAPGPLLDVLLDTLFSAPVRLAIEQQADETLQAVLQASSEALPENARGGALEAQLAHTERTARRLLRESLAAIFSPAARAELQQELELTLQAALDGSGEDARGHAELAVQSVLLQSLTAFQRNWEQLLRTLLPLLVTALQQAVATKAQEKVADLVTEPGRQVEKKVQAAHGELQQKGGEWRQRMAETAEQMQRRVHEGRDQLQARLGASLQAAGQGSGQSPRQRWRPPAGPPGGSKLGRPPGGRPPAGRPPAGPGRRR